MFFNKIKKILEKIDFIILLLGEIRSNCPKGIGENEWDTYKDSYKDSYKFLCGSDKHIGKNITVINSAGKIIRQGQCIGFTSVINNKLEKHVKDDKIACEIKNFIIFKGDNLILAMEDDYTINISDK
jgi:hypothetical protein